MDEQMGLNIEIKVDKNASNKGIKSYLDALSKDSNFQSAIKVGIDDKGIQNISKSIGQLSKMTINPLADGTIQAIKEFELANGSILKIIEQINEKGISVVESSSLQVNKIKQLADYYKNMNKLLGDKLRLEKLIENSKGEDNRKANAQLKNIIAQIEAQEDLIKTHSLYNKNSVEQLEISRKAKMNEIELAKLKLKNANGAQAEGYEKILKSQEKEFKYRNQMLTASKEETEVLQRKIEQEEKIQKSAQASLNARKLTDNQLQEVLKLNREILSDEVKAKDTVLQRAKAYQELVAIENRLMQKEKQLVGANILTSVELESQISELRIKAMEKELDIAQKGLATEEEQAKLQEVRLKNAQELAIVQAKHDDKTITKEDEQTKTEKLKRQQKVYNEILSIEKQIATLSKQQVKTDVEEKKIELTKQINALKKEQRELEITAWREGIESAEKQAEIDKKRIQTANEVATIQAEQAGKQRQIKEDKEFNAVLKEQSNLYNTLKTVVKEVNNLQAKEVTAGEEERIVIQKQLNEAIEREAQIRTEISNKQLQDVNQEAIVQELKVAGAKRLEQLEAKQLDVLDRKAKQEAEELERANTLIERSKRALQIDLERLKVSKDAKFLDKSGVFGVQQAIDNLNGTSTKQVQGQVNEIRLALRELGSNATIQRINSTSSAIDELKKGLKQLGAYASVAVVMQQLWQSFKHGVQYIKELDEAFTDVAISMDISRDKFNQWTQDARKIAQANGVTTTSLMEMVKIYATAGESIEAIGDKLAGTAMIQNITQWDAEQTTSAVSSIINQYKLLDKEINGVTGNVANAIEYMGDALVGISNELTVDNVAGIQEMVNAIDVAGGVMEQSGATMEWYMAVTGTLNETMNATGSEIGNAFKMITARVFAQAQAMEDLGESAENIEIEARKAEKALNSVGISIRDALNPAELRDMEDIMDDLAGKWDVLSDATKNYVAEGVAGTNRRSFFISMMENYDRVLELTNAGMEAQGELAKANEVRVQSLAGQINILKDKLYALMDGFEPVIYGSVQLGSTILDLVNGLGAIPSALGLVTASFLTFNEAGKGMVSALMDVTSSYVPYISNLTTLRNEQVANIDVIKLSIESIKADISARKFQGESVTDLVGKLKLEQTALKTTQLQLVATTVKTVALQAAMSMGLSLAITLAVSALSKWIGSLKTSTELMEDATESANKFKQAMMQDTQTTQDFEAYKELNKILKEGNLTLEERNQKEQELQQLRSTLSADEEIAEILNNEKLTLEEQSKWVDYILAKRKEAALIDLEESVSKTETPEEVVTTIKGAEADYNTSLEKQVEFQNKINEALAEREKIVANGGDTTKIDNIIGNYDLQLQDFISAQENAETRLMELGLKLQQTNSNVKLLHDNNKMLTVSTMDLDGTTQKLIDSLLDEKSGVEEVAEEIDNLGWRSSVVEKNLSELNRHLNNDLDASENFVALGKELENIKELMNEINKNGLTYDSMEKVQELIPEIGSGITDLATVQQALNDKFAEMEDAQSIAYSLMYDNSVEYFNNNVKDTEEWINYQAKVSSLLVDLESDMLSRKDTINNEHYKGMAELMSNDLKNANTLAQGKLAIHSKLMEEMLLLEEKFAEATMYEYDTPEARAINARIQKIRETLATIGNVEKDFLSGIKKPTYNTGSNYFSPSSSSNSSSSNKEVEDLKDVADAYYEIENALKDVNNALDLNKAKQENATGKKRVELMREEVELLKKKQRLLAQQQTEMEKERDALKKTLQNNGFTFDDEGNIKNYQQRLKELQNWANSLKGEAKEDAIEFVESLIDVIDRYTDLVKDGIPDVIQSWEEMTTAIKEAEREQLEYVTQVQKDITSAIEEEYNKRYNKLKESLQKEKDLYNAQYEQEDHDRTISQYQREINEIQQQIANLARDTSLAGQLKRQQLEQELASKQEEFNDYIRDYEKEQGNKRFDEESDKLDKELEEVLDPKNIADLVNQALVDGFVTIGNEVIELDTLMSNWLDETGDGLYAIGDILKSELVDNLTTAQELLSQMGLIDTNVSTKGRNISTTPLSTVELSTADYRALETGLQRLLQNNTSSGGQIVQIENLLTVKGNMVEDMLPQVQEMLNQATSELLDGLAQQVSLK